MSLPSLMRLIDFSSFKSRPPMAKMQAQDLMYLQCFEEIDENNDEDDEDIGARIQERVIVLILDNSAPYSWTPRNVGHLGTYNWQQRIGHQ